MKAIITIVTARKEFRQDQINIMRRVAMVLVEHDLSVDVSMKTKIKKTIPFKLKVI